MSKSDWFGIGHLPSGPKMLPRSKRNDDDLDVFAKVTTVAPRYNDPKAAKASRTAQRVLDKVLDPTDTMRQRLHRKTVNVLKLDDAKRDLARERIALNLLASSETRWSKLLAKEKTRSIHDKIDQVSILNNRVVR